jgi:hypothetical protein
VLGLQLVVLELAFGDRESNVCRGELSVDLDELDGREIELQIPIVLAAAEVSKPGGPL